MKKQVHLPQMDGSYTLLSEHEYIIHRKAHLKEEKRSIDVFGEGWVFFKAKSLEQPISIIQNSDQIPLGTQIMGYIPGKSVVEWVLPKGKYEYEILVCDIPLQMGAPEDPLCLLCDSFDDHLSQSMADFFENYRERKGVKICRSTDVSPLSLKVQDWIHENWDKPFKLYDVAEALDVNPSVISRNFKQTFGLSPLKYINQLRVVSSVRGLLKNERSIAQISYEMGFADPRMYNEHFRKIYPVTPLAFKTNKNKIHSKAKKPKVIDL